MWMEYKPGCLSNGYIKTKHTWPKYALHTRVRKFYFYWRPVGDVSVTYRRPGGTDMPHSRLVPTRSLIVLQNFFYGFPLISDRAPRGPQEVANNPNICVHSLCIGDQHQNQRQRQTDMTYRSFDETCRFLKYL